MFATMKGVTWLVPLAVLGAKASISVAFCFLYFSTLQFFPSAYLGLVMGLYNMIGRVSTVAAPMVAEMPQPVPMAASIFLCLLALLSVCLLKQADEEDAQNNKDGTKNLSQTAEVELP